MQRNEDTQRTRTVICPHCQSRQLFAAQPADPPGEAYCSNCGGALPRGPQAAAGPTTVLCIDDDPLVLHFYRAFLDQHGYRVLTAPDGLSGIELARRDHPDAILLDVMLRGLSGFDICRKLRADPKLQHTPIILITAWHDPGVVQAGQEAGATLTLLKPDDVESIPAAIQEVPRQAGSPPRNEHAT